MRCRGKSISGFAQAACDALLSYAWPGNIRELRNAVERGVILAAGPVVTLANLPSNVGDANLWVGNNKGKGEPFTLAQLEAEYIRRILASTASLGEAAEKLGINPSTLYRKRKRYGI